MRHVANVLFLFQTQFCVWLSVLMCFAWTLLQIMGCMHNCTLRQSGLSSRELCASCPALNLNIFIPKLWPAGPPTRSTNPSWKQCCKLWGILTLTEGSTVKVNSRNLQECCKKNEMVICRKCTTQQLRFDGSGRPVKPHDADRSPF